MNLRYLTLAALIVATGAVVSTRACGQEPPPPPPGVRLGINYPAGTTPKVIVMPADSAAGDSVRAIIQRDLDYSDRVAPLMLDDMTLMGMTPAPGQPYNFSLFANLGVAAIIEPKRTQSGFLVSLYDVSTQRKLQSREFRVPSVPGNRDAKLLDSITVATTIREKALRDSIYRTLKVRADVMRRPRLTKDTRDRRFVIRDSIRREQPRTCAAMLRAGKMTGAIQSRRRSGAPLRGLRAMIRSRVSPPKTLSAWGFIASATRSRAGSPAGAVSHRRASHMCTMASSE